MQQIDIFQDNLLQEMNCHIASSFHEGIYQVMRHNYDLIIITVLQSMEFTDQAIEGIRRLRKTPILAIIPPKAEWKERYIRAVADQVLWITGDDRELDWSDFNEERRYREHRADFQEYDLLSPVELEEPEFSDVQRLLDAIEDERLLHIMLGAERETLQILLLKIIGYSIQEIAEKLTIPEQTIYTRIRRLREKIKKISKCE